MFSGTQQCVQGVYHGKICPDGHVDSSLFSQPDLGSNHGSDNRFMIIGNSVSLSLLICRTEMVLAISQWMVV